MQNKGMQALLQEAQKKQRAYDKALKEIEETEYEMSKNGIIKVAMLGNKQIVSIDIDQDALNPEDKEMIEDALVKCINSITDSINDDIEDAKEATIGQ